LASPSLVRSQKIFRAAQVAVFLLLQLLYVAQEPQEKNSRRAHNSKEAVYEAAVGARHERRALEVSNVLDQGGRVGVEAEGAAQANRIEAAIRQRPRLVVVVVLLFFWGGGCKYGFRCLVFGVLKKRD
jgi:hypothetical protein